MLDKQAKAEVDKAVEEAKQSPEPVAKDLWTDIYYKGTEPPYMRGREREEVCHFFCGQTSFGLELISLVRSITINLRVIVYFRSASRFRRF